MFQVGDKVRFKTWEQMKSEYGLNDNGDIDCRAVFTMRMDSLIDRSQIYTIRQVNGETNYERIEFEEEVPSFSYSPDMIELVTEAPATQTEDAISFMDDFDCRVPLSPTISTVYCKSENLKKLRRKYESKIEDILKLMFHQEALVSSVHIEFQVVNYNNNPDVVWEHYYTNANNRRRIIVMTGGNYVEKFEKYRVTETVNDEYVTTLSVTEDTAFYKLGNVLMALVPEEKIGLEEWWKALFATVLQSLAYSTSDHFKELLVQGKVKEALDYCESIKSALLEEKRRKEFDKATEQIKDYVAANVVTVAKNKIKDAEERILDHERELASLYGRLKELQKELMYIQIGKIETENDALAELLSSDYDNISSIYVRNGRVRMTIVQPLLFFEDDDWLTIRENVLAAQVSDSFRYVVDAIFTRKCELTLETGVFFTIDGNRNFGRWNDFDEYTRGIPNPHIYQYDCWGDNKAPILAAMSENKFDIAYAQIKSALAGINIMDSPVLNAFCRGLSAYSGIPCIMDYTTGEVMNLTKANEYYRKLEEKHNEEN